MARLKSRLKKWDLDAVIKGNWEQWLSVGRYREEGIRTQIAVVGAWGRKTNLLWLGRWKGDNYGQQKSEVLGLWQTRKIAQSTI